MCATGALAADWPQWLGLRRDGTSTEKVAPWKEQDQPRPPWRHKVGQGYSALVVAGGRVALGTAAQLVDALDLTGGTVSSSPPGSLRANLFGFAIGRLEYAIPFDRPAVTGLWTFSLGPAF